MDSSFFVNAEEIQDVLGVSRAEAYRIIKKLNTSLSNQGWVDARDPFMYESINSLSTVQRSRVIDYYFGGFNMREIAERQGVSIQSVSQSIERSLKTLRENIG